MESSSEHKMRFAQVNVVTRTLLRSLALSQRAESTESESIKTLEGIRSVIEGYSDSWPVRFVLMNAAYMLTTQIALEYSHSAQPKPEFEEAWPIMLDEELAELTKRYEGGMDEEEHQTT